MKANIYPLPTTERVAVDLLMERWEYEAFARLVDASEPANHEETSVLRTLDAAVRFATPRIEAVMDR